MIQCTYADVNYADINYADINYADINYADINYPDSIMEKQTAEGGGVAVSSICTPSKKEKDEVYIWHLSVYLMCWARK